MLGKVFFMEFRTGWKGLWSDHDCQSEAMTVMASYACSDNRLVNLYEENGKIKTMYVW